MVAKMTNQRGSAIASRLRQVREQLKMTQAAFAEQLGLTVRAYSRYEAGEREPPTSALTALTRMGISVAWLLTGIGEPFSHFEPEVVSDVTRRLNGVEEELNRLKVPVAVESLGEGSALKDMYRQLIEIAGNTDLPDDLRARADQVLDLGFANVEAAGRRDGRMERGAEEMRRGLKSATDIYTAILQKLDWEPPGLVGMAVRDAIMVDGLSEEMAGFILGAMKEEMSKLTKSEGKR